MNFKGDDEDLSMFASMIYEYSVGSPVLDQLRVCTPVPRIIGGHEQRGERDRQIHH